MLRKTALHGSYSVIAIAVCGSGNDRHRAQRTLQVCRHCKHAFFSAKSGAHAACHEEDRTALMDAIKTVKDKKRDEVEVNVPMKHLTPSRYAELYGRTPQEDGLELRSD